MERLTCKFDEQNVLRAMCTFDRESETEPDDCITCDEMINEFCGQGCKECAFQKAFDRLAAYEDLEEQGLLLKLPCKVGDKLYIVNPRNEILELTVKEFIYRAYRIPRLEIYFEDGSGFETCLFDGTLNETVFLTQAEAEDALKRMEGENE